jgi:hypothetical protein
MKINNNVINSYKLTTNPSNVYLLTTGEKLNTGTKTQPKKRFIIQHITRTNPKNIPLTNLLLLCSRIYLKCK